MRILQGNVIDVLKTLDEKSVQCCITSPPYYGLRDYGTEAQIWGGDPARAHEWVEYVQPAANGIVHEGGVSGGTLSENSGTRKPKKSDFCARCCAWRGNFGLEPTPELYVEHIVLIFREVRRVLKDDGSVWLNLGDSYAGSGGVGNQRDDANKGKMPHFKNPNSYAITRAKDRSSKRWGGGNVPHTGGLKPKDLIGIPWMVAFALRNDGVADMTAVKTIERVRHEILSVYENEPIPDKVINVLERLDDEYREAKGDSWYLRSDIIWSKPNPMPESVRDRPTRSHEYIFLLSKSRKYYYDQNAIREQAKESSVARLNQDIENQEGSSRANGGAKTNGQMKAVKFGGNKAEGYGTRTHSGKEWVPTYKNLEYDGQQPNSIHVRRADGMADKEYITANKKSVWTVSTKPYKEAHFAVYPEELIEPCVLAGSRPGDIVLDIFNGSGTTGMVALKHRRDYIGIELNPKYITLTERRFRKIQPILL